MYGAFSLATATVRVRPKTLTAAQLRNISEAKAQQAIEGGNADAAKQVLAATTGALATNALAASWSSGAGRRLLGASSTDGAATRASVRARAFKRGRC